MHNKSRYKELKELLDRALAILAFTVLLPVIIAVAIAVFFRIGRPVFFIQNRIGLDEKSFKLIKFRTMASPDPDRGLITDEQRLVPLGRLLRATSLDELPSLINVIKGEMSLVGPRPLIPEYLPLYSKKHARRHEVRPGVTGLAQVNGRNATTWDDRLDWDVYYVDHYSLGLDLTILIKTVMVVLKREGISQEGQATMSWFEGSKS